MQLMKYPNKLKVCRERTNKTQPDLARALKTAGIKGATKQKVWKIENGYQRMTPQEAAVFTDILQCSMGDILPGISQKAVIAVSGGAEERPLSPFREYADAMDILNQVSDEAWEMVYDRMNKSRSNRSSVQKTPSISKAKKKLKK